MKILYNSYEEPWLELSTSLVDEARKRHAQAWEKLVIDNKGRKVIGLRGISFLVNRSLNASAYNYCSKLITGHYKQLVIENNRKYLANKPLYSLYEAPYLDDSNVPILALSLKNQCYLKEDYFSESSKKKKLLICITSRTHSLSMPNLVFHAYASRIYDGIAYFFDRDKNHYEDKQSALNTSVDQLLNLVNPSTIGFIGTSSGACPAISLYLEYKYSRIIAGSPLFDKYPGITEQLEEMNSDILIKSFKATYANNSIDNRSKSIYQKLTAKIGALSIRDMSYISNSHASLGSTLISQDFVDILKWLGGEVPNRQKEQS